MQVVPIHKKNSVLDKGNYRPVSILPALSKVFENAINTQLSAYFDDIFHPFLAAFRSGFGCQSTLLRITEDWKKAIDENKYVAEAFDCLPHDLILLKLKYYGLSPPAIYLLKSYLSCRKQCVKIGQNISSFLDIFKGVPQGSILGPVIFNIFINDIFYFVKDSALYNYADDNTISHSDYTLENVITTLEKESGVLIDWFSANKMQANPETFQAISLGKKTRDKHITFKLNGTTLACEEEVKLLGVTIDFSLNFNSHISNICKKAARQLNVLKRIGKHLCRLGKITIYHTFIMSNFSYCPLVWHFCNEQNCRKIEKIQERALRFIYDDYSSNYNQLLVKSNLPSLKTRRMRTMALEVFKIVNKQSPLFLQDLVQLRNSNYNFRYQNTLELPMLRTTRCGKNSFRYAAATLWNSFPNHVREISNFNQFRSFLESWTGESCKCSSCRGHSVGAHS